MKKESEERPPRIAISYSHKPNEHAERVLAVAHRLASDGIDVEIDKWSVREGHDLNAFMERMVTDPTVTKVLIFSNKSYTEKANARQHGVGIEAQILSAELYGKVEQEKFIPIACEFENGQACLPAFLKGRLYIDFSSAEAEAINYERLVRRIFDKPEHIKPAVGKPPAFITAQTIPANPLAGKIRAYREALLAGRMNAHILLDDYLERFIEELETRRIRAEGNEHFDETLLLSLEGLKPLRDDFVEICDLWLKSTDKADFVHHIVQVLEQLLDLGQWPSNTDQWNEHWGENFRFLSHELFLCVVGLLLKHQQFSMLKEIFETQFILPTSDKPRRIRAGTFNIFYEHSEVLDDRNKRLELRRIDLQTDLLKERATSKTLPFYWIQQADLICFLRCLMFTPDEWPWYPKTLMYARWMSSFEIFQRAESKAFYKKLSALWNDLAPEAFKERFADVLAKSRANNWGFDHVRGDWGKWMNLDKLGTRE